MKFSIGTGLKISLLLLIIAVAVVAPLYIARAGGPAMANYDISPSASSTLADGQTKITITAFGYLWECSNHYHVLNADDCASTGQGAVIGKVGSAPTDDAIITASGSGIILSASTLHVDGAGHGSFTIASTAAGAKTVQIISPYDHSVLASTTVTFTAPVAVPPPAPPAAPTLGALKVNMREVDPSKPVTVEWSKPLELSGTTVGGGVVTLTIHSTPRTETATAGADGRWTYTVNNLEPGDHYVEVAVTDPSTKQTSPTVKLVSFVVTPASSHSNIPVATTPKPAIPLGLWLSIAGGVLVVGAGVAGGFWWRRHHAKANSIPPTLK